MANASNDDGHLINRRSGKLPIVQNFSATNVRVSLLRIGEYQILSGSETHVTAKWYYTRQQLNWEILEIGRNKKIEIDWSIISAIRVAYDSSPQILEIELRRRPRFYGSPELSGSRTSWGAISDFTHGQASTSRIHHLEFSNDARLEKSMKPLFILDSRLMESTQGPFPSLGGQFFVHEVTAAPHAPPPPLINSQLLQHHQIPPNRTSVPVWSNNINLVHSMSTVQQLPSHLLPSHEDSRVSDYGYAPPPLLPINETIFTGQYMGYLPGEQITMPSTCNYGQVTTGTSHGSDGCEHNSNPNPMNFAHPWNNQGIFDQQMGHHSGLASSSNAKGMDVHSSTSYYPIPYHNHQSGKEGLIYPDLGSSHYHNHQDQQYLADYNTINSIPNEHKNGDDEMRTGNSFSGDKPPHFMP